MYKHILIPTDGSILSQAAVEHGVALAKSVGAKLTVLTVSTSFRTFAIEVMPAASTEQYAELIAIVAARYLGAARE